MSRKIRVISSFNKKGLNSYGQRMIDTFSSNWPKDIELVIYAENCNPSIGQHKRRITIIDQNKEVEDLLEFKRRWSKSLKANGYKLGLIDFLLMRKVFLYDAIRFSHKAFSIFHAAKTFEDGILFWMDGDMVCHSEITLDFILSKCPSDIDTGFLGRTDKFTECGLVYFNLDSKNCRLFITELEKYWKTGRIFDLQEWHDAYIFDYVRYQQDNLKEFDWSKDLITGEGHPLINSEWGAYLDHVKGDRKISKKSWPEDLIIKREESYWNKDS